MNISLCFYNEEKLLELKKILDKNKLSYDIEEDTITIYSLNSYACNFNNKLSTFYIDFFNFNNKFVYMNIEKNDIYDLKIESE